MDVKYDHVIHEHDMGDMIIKKEKKKREPHKLVIINEEELIRQVEIRPILYDKSLKGYRKTALRDQCWKDIAASVNSSVAECRKRWRSLRDAFAKHYKQFDVTMNSKKKKWIFFDQMFFIASYLDCSNSTQGSNTHITQLQDNSHESILINNEEHLEQQEESSDFKPHIHHHHLHHQDVSTATAAIEHVNVDVHHHQQHHQADDGTTATTTTHISAIDLNDDNQFVARIYTTTEPPSEYDSQQTTIATTAPASVTGTITANTVTTRNVVNHRKPIVSLAPAADVPGTTTTTVDAITVERCDDFTTVSTTDSDERFLLSCAPILKRLSNKNNALARLRIQQILYSIEFGDQ